MNRQIVISTTTFYPRLDGINAVRARHAIRLFEKAQERSIPVAVMDGGSHLDFVRQMLDLGVSLAKDDPGTFGQDVRSSLRLAGVIGGTDGIFFRTEPEKADMADLLDTIVEPIVSGNAEYVNVGMDDLSSYPPVQQRFEELLNHHFRLVTGLAWDMRCGPKCFNWAGLLVHLGYKGDYGDMWDAIHIPTLRAHYQCLRVVQVIADLPYPEAQRLAEADDLDLFWKRARQLVVAARSYEAEALAHGRLNRKCAPATIWRGGNMERKVVLSTITHCTRTTPVEIVRTKLAVEFFEEARRLGLLAVTQDGGSDPAFLETIRNLGAIVLPPHPGSTFGDDVRRSLGEASTRAGPNGSVFRTEAQKGRLLTQLPAILEPIYSGSAIMVRVMRRSLDSYPAAQQWGEMLQSAYFKALTGLPWHDVCFGPLAIARKAMFAFLAFSGEDESSINIPPLRLVRRGKPVETVTVDWEYPQEQAAIETGDPLSIWRIARNALNQIEAYREEWNAPI